jgi:hypothetical protein
VTASARRASGTLAWVAIACIALGSVIAVIPVSNPGVQSCGAPIDFLVRGDFDRLPDADGRIERDGKVVRLDQDARRRAVDHPCSERVERRAIPAGILVVGGSLMGMVAMAVAVTAAWRRAATRAQLQTETEFETDRAEVP